MECGTAVWTQKDGAPRYELSECPVSVLSREPAAVLAASQWRTLGRFPWDWHNVDLVDWQKTSALYDEAEWYSNQTKDSGQD